MKWKKRLVSLVLALCMVVTMLPTTFAADNAKNPFTDVKKGAWYYRYVQGVYEQGLMAGTSPTTFEPDLTLSRAMVVQILYNKEGKPQASGENVFTDVKKDDWYYFAVQWAAQNNVVSGVGNKKFDPSASVTREQLATMLYNYAGRPEVSGELTSFPDADLVSDWAKTAMFWAVNQSIMAGSKQNDETLLLMPKSGATRAEAATMVYRYVQVLDNNIKKYTVIFESNGGTQIETQTVIKGEKVNKPNNPTRDGYAFAGWFKEDGLKNGFQFAEEKVGSNIKLYAAWINIKTFEDQDNDGITDDVEKLLGLDPTKSDTDGDGLADYLEINVTYTNPLKVDTDEDGIKDGDEDLDGDGLTNLQEIALGTEIRDPDTDGDGLSDFQEVNRYSTDPLKQDTDDDGVSDGKEIELGTDPLTYQESFDISLTSDKQDAKVNASVDVTLAGMQVETLDIESVENPTLFPEDIPGYIGEAYDFSVDGTFDTATIKFKFDDALLKTEGFDPVIYYYNEEKQALEELETQIDGNVASAKVNHFSTYILINRKVFSSAFEWQDNWSDDNYTGVDVAFVIDDSGSMWSNDRGNERLTVARDLIDKLPQSSRVGVVKFESRTSVLTQSLIEDKEVAKEYLTTDYFSSDGGTAMYTAIDDAFALFEQSDETVLKMMIVLSDGNADDTGKHSSIVSKAVDENIKIYTVGLGSSTTYFSRYLQPLAENTGGVFYLASNAAELSGIYEDISNKIDIETDSDSDGIPDYYEDHMCIFNGCKLPLDKNNPDTDGDGLLDGEEITLSYEYNEDKTKVQVTGVMKSNPTMIDSDGDGLYDNAARVAKGVRVAPKDPKPLEYNGNIGAWKKHVQSAETEVIPTEYCKDESGFKNMPDWLVDVGKSLSINTDSVTDNELTRKILYPLLKGGYLICLNWPSDVLNRGLHIKEIDEVVGAWILNFIHDDQYIAYHSQPDTWQMKAGYNRSYDDWFGVGTDMVTSEAIEFNADDKTYALWMWKGDYYNLHSGAEIGLYQYTGDDEKTGIRLYDAIDFRLPMSLNLYYTNSLAHLFGWAPTVKQWWITGFNTDKEYEEPKRTPMTSVGTINFGEHPDMYNSLKWTLSDENSQYKDFEKYFIFDEDGRTVWIMWDQLKNRNQAA